MASTKFHQLTHNPVYQTSLYTLTPIPFSMSSFSNSTSLPEEPAITWMEYIAEADLKEPEYQKSISLPSPSGSASVMPISKLYFSNADEVREVCSIGMEDILTNMEDYFMEMFDHGPESAKTDLLKADDLQSLRVKVPHSKLAHLGIQSNVLPHISQFSEHLNATDELSFAQNVRQEVLNTVAELLMRIKSQQPGHNVQRQFYVKPYDAEKLSPITYAVLQSGHNPDSEERKNSAILAAFIVPPWRMGEQELRAFAVSQRIPRLDDIFPRQPGMKRGYNRTVSVDTTNMSSGLWALIHGRCKADNIDHFVLTTYEHWVFGAFAAGQYPNASNEAKRLIDTTSADHPTAYISPPIPRSSTDPTIMEMLMFWTLSSASDGEGWWAPAFDADEGKRKTLHLVPTN
ncbi:hypothetical protein BC629DRAFT_469218 [Irpex lacteus]|nr:hypothetical protein BC629DRAFT_469218 [Irpex lacteus]